MSSLTPIETHLAVGVILCNHCAEVDGYSPVPSLEIFADPESYRIICPKCGSATLYYHQRHDAEEAWNRWRDIQKRLT